MEMPKKMATRMKLEYASQKGTAATERVAMTRQMLFMSSVFTWGKSAT